MNLQDAIKLPPGSPELKKEIEERRVLIRQMVGWLYPAILSDEIDALIARNQESANDKKD